MLVHIHLQKEMMGQRQAQEEGAVQMPLGLVQQVVQEQHLQ
jgi:hypothetical protein